MSDRIRPFRALVLTGLCGLLGTAGSHADAADSQCRFQGGPLVLNFGVLDPSDGRDIAALASAGTLNADRAGDCTGVSFVIEADNGLYFAGTRRLRGPTGDYIPYSLVGVPTPPQPGPGNGVYVRFSLSGTIRGSDYLRASAGFYRDSVLLTISP
jgi:hypothetical protein